MPAIACAVRSQPKTLTLLLLALALDRGDRAHQRRLAGGVDRGHVRIAGDQVLGRGERVVLDVLAVDDAGLLDVRAPAIAFSKPSWRTFWMNELSAPTMPIFAFPPAWP